MKQTTIPVKPDVRVVVRCNDDLSVEGNDSSVLVVVVDQSDCLHMKEEDGLFKIVANSDCRLMLPSTGTITIEKVGCDCHVDNFENRVVIGKIGDDLKMTNVGGASIESVGSDCRIQNASGAIEIARVGDDLSTENTQSVLANSVGCDVKMVNARGKVEVNAGDDIRIHTDEANVPEIHAKAGSDIRLFIPTNANCQLNITSNGEEINIHACGQDVDAEEQQFSLPLGEGGNPIVLIAGDDVMVSDQEVTDWKEDPEIWNDQRWKNFGIELSENIRQTLANAGNSVEQALRHAEHATRNANVRVETIMRDLDERGFGSGRGRKMVGFSMNADKAANAAAKAGASDEERMLVLRMLQDKKISVEEADKLLNALER